MQGLFEKFFILFETDAARVEQETDAATASADSLAQALSDASAALDPGGVEEVNAALSDAGVQAQELAEDMAEVPAVVEDVNRELKEADENSRDLDESWVKMAGTLGAWVGGLLSVGAVLGGLRDRFAEIVDMGERASRFNFNVEGLTAFGGVIEEMGGNADDAERYVRRFSDGIRAAFGDVESAQGKAFAALGVSLGGADGKLRDTEAIIYDLAGALEGVSDAQAVDKLRSMGIVDPALIELLTQGRVELERLMGVEKQKNLINEETARKVRLLKMAQDDLVDVWTALQTNILGALSGPLKGFLDWLTTAATWLTQNQALLGAFAATAVTGLGVVLAFLYGAYIPGWIAAAAATVAATWPIIAVGVAIAAVAAAVALLWEDFQAFANGQPSLLGELVNKYEWVRKTVEALGKAFDWIKENGPAALALLGDAAKVAGDVLGFVFRQLWRVAGPIFELIGSAAVLLARQMITALRAAAWLISEAWERWGPTITAVAQIIGGVMRFIAGVFAAVGRGIWSQWGTMFDNFVKRIQFVSGAIRALIGLGEQARAKVDAALSGGRAAKGLPEAQAALREARATPLAAQTSASVGARTSSRSEVNVEVKKVEVVTQSTDANGMASAASGALNKELRKATADMQTGVAR